MLTPDVVCRIVAAVAGLRDPGRGERRDGGERERSFASRVFIWRSPFSNRAWLLLRHRRRSLVLVSIGPSSRCRGQLDCSPSRAVAPGVEHPARPSRRWRTAALGRAPVDPRVRGLEVGASARAQTRRRTARTASPRRRRSASGAIPTGVASTGTSQASASSVASPNPSRSDGTSTALAALTNSGTRSGSTPPSVSSARVAGDLLRAIEALLGPRRVGREQHVRAVGIEPELGARVGARRCGLKRPSVDAAGSTARRPGGAAQRGICSRQRLGDRRRRDRRSRSPASVIGRERGWARSVPCSVTARAARRARRAPARSSGRSGRGRCRSARRRAGGAAPSAPST